MSNDDAHLLVLALALKTTTSRLRALAHKEDMLRSAADMAKAYYQSDAYLKVVRKALADWQRRQVNWVMPTTGSWRHGTIGYGKS